MLLLGVLWLSLLGVGVARCCLVLVLLSLLGWFAWCGCCWALLARCCWLRLCLLATAEGVKAQHAWLELAVLKARACLVALQLQRLQESRPSSGRSQAVDSSAQKSSCRAVELSSCRLKYPGVKARSLVGSAEGVKVLQESSS